MHQPPQMGPAVPRMAARYVATGKMVDVAAPLASVEVVQGIVAVAASQGPACLAFRPRMVLVGLRTATRSVDRLLVVLVAQLVASVVGMIVIVVRVETSERIRFACDHERLGMDPD